MRLNLLACLCSSLLSAASASLPLEDALTEGIREYDFGQVILHLDTHIASNETKRGLWDLKMDPNGPRMLTDMLLTSKSFLEYCFYGLLKERVKGTFGDNDVSGMTPDELAGRKKLALLLWRDISCRTNDMAIAQLPLIYGKLVELQDIVPSEIVDHLYKAGEQYHYLPPSDASPKLFDQWHYVSIASMMATGEHGQLNMFTIPIIIDYLLPAFIVNMELDPLQKGILSSIPGINHALGKLATQLLWASYFTEGGVSSTNTVRTIEAGFRRAGLEWDAIRYGLGKLVDFQAALPERIMDTLPIFMVAKVFGLDIGQMAANIAHIDPLAHQIVHGDAPEGLNEGRTPSLYELFYSIYENEPVKMFMHEGQLQTLQAIEAKKTLITPEISETRTVVNRPKRNWNSSKRPRVVHLTENEDRPLPHKFIRRITTRDVTETRPRAPSTTSDPIFDFGMDQPPPFDDFLSHVPGTAFDQKSENSYQNHIWPAGLPDY